MIKKAAVFLLITFILCFSQGFAQTLYKLPPKDVVKILDTPLRPRVVLSPQKDAMAMISWDYYPPIRFLAQPYIKLAGLRINPKTNGLRRMVRYKGINIKNLKESKDVPIKIPAGSNISMPKWSYDGKRIAFMRYLDNSIDICISSTKTGETKILDSIRLNYTVDKPFQWMPGSKRLLIKIIPQNRRKMSEKPIVPSGPIVEETSGKFSQVPTYQDLLKTPYDDEFFQYLCTSQLAAIDVETGQITPIGKPGIFMESRVSPNGKYILVTRLTKPYSHGVPYYYFKRSKEIWEMKGKLVRTIADLPASEEVPRHGRPTGPRLIEWQPFYGAKLVWSEALDGGDVTKDVPFHDKIMTLNEPFDEKPEELLNIKQRFSSFTWLDEKDEVFVKDYDRKRQWITTTFFNLSNPEKSKKVIFDLSVNDGYNYPGNPVKKIRPDGEIVVIKDGDWIYLAGKGASKEGDRPFLNRLNIKTLKKKRIFQCGRNCYESFISFIGNSRELILTRYESKTDPPNYYIHNLKSNKKIALTNYKDPAPQLKDVKTRIIKFKREDGVPLSGTLYLPPGYKKGTRLPLIMWAYPLEYNDPKTAGQVRGSPNKFSRPWGCSPKFFLTQGYAVFYASMPVVGDPDTVNNTFLKQIVANAKAAIEKLDSMGIIDRKKVLIGGHSYGAFMTVHLLGNSDLFAAGIARSGAYNRTLTPFGFQSERRTLWEAPEFYLKISPITHANKIKEPLLIIHGQVDSNPGTYTMQSERLFQAVKGHGGTAKLVLLPMEGHWYYARESNLHVIAEMFEWADKYLKGKKTSE